MCFDSGRRERLDFVAFKYFENVDFIALRTVFTFLVKLLAI